MVFAGRLTEWEIERGEMTRKLDALVAERVEGFVYKLGLQVGGCLGSDLECYGWGQPGFSWVNPEGPAHYSSDIVIAMQLESKLSHFVLRRLGSDNWQCESAHCGDWLTHVTNDCGCKHADANTAPLAISIAVCRAYSVSEDEIQGALNQGAKDAPL